MPRTAALLLLALALLALGWMARKPENPPPKEGAVLPGGAVVAYSPGYRVSFFGVERLHPFDIGKYDRIAEHLVEGGWVPEGGFIVPEPATPEQLAAVHDADYLASLSDAKTLAAALEVPLPGFLPASTLEARVLAPFRRAVGGTLAAARGALEHGLGVNLGGGYHHARPDMGHGFCVYNDVAVALAALRASGELEGPVLIIDTDAHQGDGDHAFFADDPNTFSMSLHQGSLFPTPKLVGDADVELKAGDGDPEMMAALEDALDQVLPDDQPLMQEWALVVHVAGADVLADDPLANLTLTPAGMAQRDRMVLQRTRARGIPLLHVLAGGYGPSAAEAQAQSIAGLLQELQRAPL